jgi:hypothetical protein
MADNLIIKDGAGNSVIKATKDIGSGVQLEKVVLTDASGAPLATLPVSIAAPVPVTVAVLGAQDEAVAASDTATSGVFGLLKRIAQRITALIAALPFSVTRYYNYAGTQRIVVGAGGTRSTAITGTEVLLHANTRCFFAVGDVTVTASAGAGVPLESGEKFHLRITTGQFLYVVQDTAGGFISIVPVL